MIGQTLSHFKITAKLGEGGMGEVYRAEDTKLGREVAIKVLPEAFTADPERFARFEREAQVLASLNHSNIAGIYEIGDDGGVHFLAMELAHGEDLATRLESGALPLDAALSVALQIAAALEAAHDRGIVHRDLKPANVMLAPSGAVKVLDFGLAKAWDAGSGSDPNLTASPTLTAQMTQAGVILGTAGYMSPEQARGQEADRRCDIWSFGVVLHEMLTGHRLFRADTVSDTLARVLMAEPEWDEIDSELPRSVATLLRRCLERDVGRRLQAIGEARIAIGDYLTEPDAPGPAALPVATSGTARSGAALMGIAALLLAVGGLAGWLLSSGLSGTAGREVTAADVSRLAVRPLGEGGFVAEDVHTFAISRDGNRIVFAANTSDNSTASLYLKTEKDAEPRLIPTTEGARNPFFSPDGQWVGFFTDSGLLKVSLQGGSSTQLVPTFDRRGADWHPNGNIYFAPHSDGPILQVSDRGGEASALTELDSTRNERTHRWPAVLPDGRGLLYTSDTIESTEYYDDARIEWIGLEAGETKVVLEGSSRAVYSPTGHLVFARDGSLYAAPFDLDEIEVRGPERLVVQNVSTTVASGAVQFAIAGDGTLAYIPGGKTAEVFDLQWLREEPEEPEIVASRLGQFVQSALSPQGDQVALVDASQEMTDIWIYDLERGSKSRLTFSGNNFDPVWSPDGRTVFFRSDTPDASGIFSKRADGRGDAEPVWQPDGTAFPTDVSPDGRYLLAALLEVQSPTQRDGVPVWLVDLQSETEPYLLFDEPVAGYYAEISPDGKWLTYSSRVTGRSTIYVRPFPEGAGKWQVSTDPSREPRWSANGKRIFFRTPRGYKYVEVDFSDGFRASPPSNLTTANMMTPLNHTYSVSRDGQQVLTLRPADADEYQAIHVVTNWHAELEELMRPPG